MKKEYNKPTVEIMKIEGNDVICGSCADKGHQTAVNKPLLEQIFNVDRDPNISNDEKYNTFSQDETCKYHVDVTDYCKFQSVESGKPGIAWS